MVGHACNLRAEEKNRGKNKIFSPENEKYIVWMEKDLVESIPGIHTSNMF